MKLPGLLELVTTLTLTSQCQAVLDGSRFLWYTSPAQEWEQGALPIGNGRLGGTIFGGADEVFTLNENTIWSGPLQDRVSANAIAALPIAREMLLAGNISAAGDYIQREMNPPEKSERAFSYFGNMDLTFGHSGQLENYLRWLDTRKGNAGVSYVYGGVNYTREYIASYPAGVLAARFTASKQHALTLNASFSRLGNILTNLAASTASARWINMTGTSGQPASQNPILFTGKAVFVAPGATFQASGSSLLITNATVIDMFFDAETNYRYSTQTDRDAEISRKLGNAVRQGYDRVKKEALDDADALLERASLDLGQSPASLTSLPTNERVLNARTDFSDIELTTLTWNYGRHLLVASSRNTGEAIDMPANLQGTWNNKTTAAWGGKFTININTEMNYWPAGQTNLIETQEPLFDLMKVAKPRGESMAQRMYGCNGTVFHHNLDLWGDPGPTDNYTSSTMWPMGAAWLVQHMLDHYRFTGDKAFLANTAYPYLVDVAKFYECYTFNWEGYRITGPSLSPENAFAVPANFSIAGKTAAMEVDISMDNQLMTDVFTGLIEAAAVLGISDTDPDLQAAKAFLPLIRPPQIGSLGQILEWRYEYQEKAKGHRHLSPLYSLHPGAKFSPLINATLSKAAGVLLDRRLAGGSGSTGWSRTWFINQYARLYRGADAWEMVRDWFKTYPTGNLWNTDSGSNFQIDGNFGFTSGITEMLLQSHAGVVHLLPALPGQGIPAGSVRGLKARGNFEVDIEWADGAFTNATVVAVNGGELKLRVQNGTSFFVNGEPYSGPLATRKGAKYTINT